MCNLSIKITNIIDEGATCKENGTAVVNLKYFAWIKKLNYTRYTSWDGTYNRERVSKLYSTQIGMETFIVNETDADTIFKLIECNDATITD